jgi:hypothetical protein
VVERTWKVFFDQEFPWSSPPKANKESVKKSGVAVRERIMLSFCACAGLRASTCV